MRTAKAEFQDTPSIGEMSRRGSARMIASRVLWTLVCLVCLLVLSLAGCTGKTATTSTTAIANASAPPPENNFSSPMSQGQIAATSPAFAWWQAQFPGVQWAALGRGDINNDGRGDVVVVYPSGGGKFSLVAVLNLTSGYKMTDTYEAPVEEQVIRVFNMDDRPPLEFSVTGQKGDDVGYAIFNIVNDKLVLMMATGYGACC